MSALQPLARHVSPDGELVILAECWSDAGGPTCAVGFEGLPWHVHPDLFMDRNGRSLEQLSLDLIADVIADNMLLVIRTTGDHRDVRIVDSIENEVDYKRLADALEFRFWSGRQVSIDDLIDRKVVFKPLS